MGAVQYRLATNEEVNGPIARGRFRVFYRDDNPGSLVGIRDLSPEEVAAECVWDRNRDADQRGIHMAAVTDGTIVGSLRAIRLRSDADRQFWRLQELVTRGVQVPENVVEVAELGRLYVLPEYRGRGIARGLQQAMREHLAVNCGVKIVVGAVSSKNTPSAKLVESLGRQIYFVDHNEADRPDFIFRYEVIA